MTDVGPDKSPAPAVDPGLADPSSDASVLTPHDGERIRPSFSGRSRIVLYLLGYIWAFVLYGIALEVRNHRDPALNKEEVHHTFRNLSCLENRAQSDPSATSISAYVIFWLGSFIAPADIHQGQWTKIALMSALGPLMLSVLLRMSPLRRIGAAAFLLATLPLLPSLSWLTINGIDYGVETLFGLAVLRLGLAIGPGLGAVRTGGALVSFLVLTAFSVHVFVPALAPIAASWGEMACRFMLRPSLRLSQRLLRFGMFALFGAIGAVLCLWPYLLIRTRPLSLLTGGAFRVVGQDGGAFLGLTPAALMEGANLMLHDMFVRAPSYSYIIFHYVPFSAMPLARGGAAILFLAMIGLLRGSLSRPLKGAFRTVLRRVADAGPSFSRAAFIISVMIVVDVALLIAGAAYAPGLRRAYPLVCGVLMLATVGADRVLSYLCPRRERALTMACIVAVALSSFDLWYFPLTPRYHSVESNRPASATHESAGFVPVDLPEGVFTPGTTLLGRPADAVVTQRGLPKKNLVLILVPGLRVDYLDSLGGSEPVAPFLARLRERSIRPERAVTTATDRGKASLSALCGHFPYPGVWDLEEQRGWTVSKCLPALLRNAGYETMLMKASESWSPVNERVLEEIGFARVYSADDVGIDPADAAGVEVDAAGRYPNDVLLRPTDRWLRYFNKKPFFMTYLLSAGEFPTGPLYGDEAVPANPRIPEVLEKHHRWAANGARRQDRFIERLFERYEAAGLADETVFVVVGTSGLAFAEHEGSFGDRSVPWNEAVQVPFFVHARGGGHVLRGVTASLIDVLPTALDAIGVTVDGWVYPGAPLREQPMRDEPRPLPVFCLGPPPCGALIKGDRKFIGGFGERPDRLYDFISDPAEERDLAEREPERVRDMRSELARITDAIASAHERELFPLVAADILDALPATAEPRSLDLGEGLHVVGTELPLDTEWRGMPLIWSVYVTRLPGSVVRHSTTLDLTGVGRGNTKFPLYAPILDRMFPPHRWPEGKIIRITTRFQVPDDWSDDEPVLSVRRVNIFDPASSSSASIAVLKVLRLRDAVALAVLAVLSAVLVVGPLRTGRGLVRARAAALSILLLISLHTFYVTYSHVAHTLQSWLILQFTRAPDEDFEDTVERLLVRMQEAEVRWDLDEFSPDYIPMFEVLCKRRDLGCKTIHVEPFNDWNLDSCMQNVRIEKPALSPGPPKPLS